MCGIAGYVNGDGRPADADLLQHMLAAIRHRGPDGQGIHIDGSVGLGHVRLSILDLAGGHQPMTNEDGTLWVTFNGEIFNYLELRDELQKGGHRFATRSDTEVILHAYEEYGDACVERFNGQWAFALWDSARRRLFLSRDRLGVRPLFYTRCDERLLFASEVKAIFTCPEVPRSLDYFGLAQIFTLWTTVAPRTIFEDIHELPPGHSLVLEDGQLRTWAYWRLTYPPAGDFQEANDGGDALLGLLEDATRLRLRSDVPVGTYLSGGLDSSFTTALVRQACPAALRSFSVAFDDPEFDESAFQQDVARFLHTDHEALACRPEDIGQVFPDVIRHTEKPILRTAPAPLYLLAQRVRQSGFKVVVTGEGADEVLGGYDIFKEHKVRRFWGRNPASAWRPLLLRRLYPYLPNLQAQPPAYLRAFFQPQPAGRFDLCSSHRPRWELTGQLLSLLSADVRATLGDFDARAELRGQLPPEFARWHPFCRAQYLEARYLLPGYILSSQGDRMAMAHAVEGRFPFLDHRVVELAGRLPPRQKMCGLTEKFLLKRIAAGRIPDEVRQRPKQPYRAPDAVSFFGVPGRPLHWDYVETLLDPARLRQDGVFHPEAATRLIEKARRGQAQSAKDNMALVGMLSTQLLIEQMLSRRPAPQKYATFATMDS